MNGLLSQRLWALALTPDCGAESLAQRVRRELAGGKPAGALTPSERRVAELARAGRTNREIAQELWVTVKTVELHLTNTYRKLAIRSRRELETAL
jgi:DNA-binding NarL/FixJ family response regulator